MEKTNTNTTPEFTKLDKILSTAFIGIVAAMLVFMVGFLIGSNTTEKKLYPAAGKVIDVDWASDTVTIEIGSGFRYQLHGCEDWEVGDNCSMVMNPMGTNLIYDDLILKAYYEVIE